MVQFNVVAREVHIKLVYYGPALSGKTTNLQKLHEAMNPDIRGRLMTLDTKDDRTLFFDLLPVRFTTTSGYQVKLKVFTVPGQVFHDSTRRVVLQGADGVAFIADSQRDQQDNNRESFNNLRTNCEQNKLDFEKLPVVIQFNKRDLNDIVSEDEIAQAWKEPGDPVYLASAIDSSGVVETFLRLLELTLANLNAKHDLGERFGMSAEDFVASLSESFGRKDHAIPPGLV